VESRDIIQDEVAAFEEIDKVMLLDVTLTAESAETATATSSGDEALIQLQTKVATLQRQLEEHQTNTTALDEQPTYQKALTGKFRVHNVVTLRTKIRSIFKYYTGLSYERFMTLFNFLHPAGFLMEYEKGRLDINRLLPVDCFFLTMCRLRHNCG